MGSAMRGGSLSPDGCGEAVQTGSPEEARPSDPSSPSSSDSSNEEDDLEALRRPEESDDRLNPGNRRSMEAIQGHMVLCLPQLSSDLPAPPRHLSRDQGGLNRGPAELGDGNSTEHNKNFTQ